MNKSAQPAAHWLSAERDQTGLRVPAVARAPVFAHAVLGRRGAQAARPFVSKVEGKRGYEDFVWFILSEEDKTNDVSLEYWFRCACARTRAHAEVLFLL